MISSCLDESFRLHHCGTEGRRQETFAREFLPHYADCKNFINGDLIALGLSPFSPEAAAFLAGRLMIEEIQRFAKRDDDFGFETTLSGTTYLDLIRRLRGQGYAVHIFFLWLSEVALSLSRIKSRVLKGGHDVPEPIVRRRYERSIKNFLRLYRHEVDSWIMFDNSAASLTEIALEKPGTLSIINAELYETLLRRYGAP